MPLMESLIVVFMVLVVVMCAFTVFVVVRDMVNERKKCKEENEKVTEDAIPEVEPHVAASVSEENDQISFSPIPKKLHSEKYRALSGEQRGWYDEISAHAKKKSEDIKFSQTNGHEEYRLYGKRVVRFVIKHGTVICEYMIANPNFSRYLSANKQLSVKQAATAFKVESSEDVGAAKDSIDIAVAFILDERAEAKRQEKERRRLARQQAAAAKTAESDNNN